MSVTILNRTTYLQINTVAQICQAQGGRIQVADSATPAANDFIVYQPGVVFSVTGVKFALALDVSPNPIYVSTVAP